MAIVPAITAQASDDSTVSLARYAQIIGYDECAFFGVRRADPPAVHSNKPLWLKSEREQVRHFLAEAQREIEGRINYFLEPRWVVGSLDDADGNERLVDNRPYSFPILARWGPVIEAGVRAETSIASGEAVDHSNDPAVVGPVATTVTDTDEVRVYHPGTEIEIHPSAIAISGGNMTISIPRCRLLTQEADNDTSGVDYTDTGAGGPFEQTVDLARVYNDPSTHAELVWPHCCSATCVSYGCSEYTRTGCIYIKNARLGTLDVLPGTYSGGAWARSSLTCYTTPERVRLNYRAGMQALTGQAEDAIVRLAHAKMPHDPCNVSPPLWLWQRDRNIPAVLTRERLNCAFGLSDGAWAAWRFAMDMKLVRNRGGTL